METDKVKTNKFPIFFGVFLGFLAVGIGMVVLPPRLQRDIAAGDAAGVVDNGPAEYEQYQKQVSVYETAMKADTAGGKTPEETLRMFIDALRKGDAGLAAQYTLLDISDPDLRAKWKADIEKKKSDGRLNEIADILSRAVYDASSSYADTAWFSVLNENGMADYSALLKFNTYSGVWKIEGM